jgi:hypothetical protein
MIRTGESSRTPIAAIRTATTNMMRKVTDSVDSSLVRASTSSHTTASTGDPGAARSAWTAPEDSEVLISSVAIAQRPAPTRS